ncbi:MAG TPA: GH116 family glycosyl-hydrolase, partial [Thermomicrobiales bacterium]|nr:GH116 family glycosyl-hydrolase [Thermomicrobiales bacterium]
MTVATAPTRKKLYRDEATRAVAMPLGGIGTGTIALAGDGSLRQWQIHNQIDHLACVPQSFFAVWARSGDGEPVAKVLQSPALYGTEPPVTPPNSSNDHVVPLCHQR